MNRQRTLKIVLVVVGLLFLAGIYPLAAFFSQEPSVAMIMSLYVTMGIFLLLAAREPSAHRSLIAYVGWANVAHAGVTAVQEYRHLIEPKEMAGIVLFAVVGLVLIALTPARKSGSQVRRQAA